MRRNSDDNVDCGEQGREERRYKSALVERRIRTQDLRRSAVPGHRLLRGNWGYSDQGSSNSGVCKSMVYSMQKASGHVVRTNQQEIWCKHIVYPRSCQPGFIFKVDGVKAAVQNPESRKNTNKWLQFDKVESFILMRKVLIDGEGKRGKKLYLLLIFVVCTEWMLLERKNIIMLFYLSLCSQG